MTSTEDETSKRVSEFVVALDDMARKADDDIKITLTTNKEVEERSYANGKCISIIKEN